MPIEKHGNSLGLFMIKVALSALLLLVMTTANAEMKSIDIYSEQQLLDLIVKEAYLDRVKLDDCQLLQDIEAKAEILKEPLYQFLWGEMLNYGVCTAANPSRGMSILKQAAHQGSLEAMVKVAQYYHDGRFVVQNKERAVQYVLPAAANGNQIAAMMLVRLLFEGYGSPRDYGSAYHWLYQQVFSDQNRKMEAIKLLQGLEARMPASYVARARKASFFSP